MQSEEDLSADKDHIGNASNRIDLRTIKLTSCINWSSLLYRMTTSCLIYLKSTDKERKSIDEKSRFYYIKRELENLDADEEKELFRYITHKRLWAKKPLEINEPLDESVQQGTFNHVTKAISGKFTRVSNSKKKMKEFLSHEKYGKMLSRLMMDFLNADNPDYKCYLDSKIDELDLGEIGIRKLYMKEEARLAYRSRLEDLREYYRQIVSL